MTDRLNEFRNFASRCREQAEESTVPEVQDRHLKLAEMLEQTVAEIESGDVLRAVLDEVVLSLPTQMGGDDVPTDAGEQPLTGRL